MDGMAQAGLAARAAVAGRQRPGAGTLARLNGSDFVVLLPGELGAEGMHVVELLAKCCSR